MPVLIAHRGNFSGVNTARENTLAYVDEALERGFHAEIDLRIKRGDEGCTLWLGHDVAHEPVTLEWIAARQDRLWVHCKDLEALEFALKNGIAHAFFHDRDDFTLTTCGKIWTYPGREVTDRSIVVVFPGEQLSLVKYARVWGVCADNFSDKFCV